jgi:hypothetical protein
MNVKRVQDQVFITPGQDSTYELTLAGSSPSMIVSIQRRPQARVRLGPEPAYDVESLTNNGLFPLEGGNDVNSVFQTRKIMK